MSSHTRAGNGAHEGEARRVEAGDTLPSLTPGAAERDAVSRGVERSQAARALTLRDALASHAKGEPGGDVIAQLRALLEGASPDERRALKKLLWAPSEDAEDLTDPDRELSRTWRDGGYPYKNLMARDRKSVV